MPVMRSGYRIPQNTVSTMIPIAALMMSRLSAMNSIEVSGQSLHDRTEQQGGEEGECADQHDDPDQENHERQVVGAHRPEAGGTDSLAGQRSGHGEREQDWREAG